MTCGPGEGLVILVVLLVVLGPAIVPRIARNVGKYAGSFRRGMREIDVRREIEGELIPDDEGGGEPPGRSEGRCRRPAGDDPEGGKSENS